MVDLVGFVNKDHHIFEQGSSLWALDEVSGEVNEVSKVVLDFVTNCALKHAWRHLMTMTVALKLDLPSWFAAAKPQLSPIYADIDRDWENRILEKTTSSFVEQFSEQNNDIILSISQ